jgi:hypothetical protein
VPSARESPLSVLWACPISHWLAAPTLALLPPACFFASLAAFALPVALVRIPPLLDYPNHLARLWLLAGGAEKPPLSAMYAVDWSGASTNLGIDLLGVTLGRAIGAEILGKLLVAAALILPPLGAALLNRAVFTGWHWWLVGFATLAWNSTLLAGFLSFQIGLGLGLLAAATDPVIVHRVGLLRTVLVRMGLSGALFVFHPFASAFYAVLLGGLAIGSADAARHESQSFADAALRGVLVMGMTIAVPVGIFLIVAHAVPGGHAPAGVFDVWQGYTASNKALTVVSAIVTYDWRIDLCVALALWAIARLAASGALLRVHTGLLVVALGLFTLALVVPSMLAGTAFVDWRFPIMAAFSLFAAIRPGLRSRRAEAVASCCLLLLSVARTVWIADIWRARQADVVAVEHALAPVPAGASVLPVMLIAINTASAPRGRYLLGQLPSYLHYPALAVPWRSAFVPTLFTARGKQPLRVLAPWNSMSVPEGVPVPVPLLGSFEPSPWNQYFYGFATDWRNRFCYVLVVNADQPRTSDEAVLSELELVADESFARLYRIRRAGLPADLCMGAAHVADRFPNG